MSVDQVQVHAPVLLDEVITALEPASGQTYLDGTFGAGGYSRAILEAADCTLIAIDRDPDAIARGQNLQEIFGERLILVEGRFGDLDRIANENSFEMVDGIALDLGVSSPQIDTPERGFSFRDDGPLDMRMEKSGRSAADVVNEESEKTLADIIYEYGDERRSRRIAKAIVTARANGAISRTSQLAEIVREVMPSPKPRRKGEKAGIDPATRTFQALRIFVNRELIELDRGLVAAERLLSPGGRLAVVSFHSLEDRRVKAFLRKRCGVIPRPSRHDPAGLSETLRPPSFKQVTRKAISAGEDETSRNPRARSAKLRVAVRTDAPAWGPDDDMEDAA